MRRGLARNAPGRNRQRDHSRMGSSREASPALPPWNKTRTSRRLDDLFGHGLRPGHDPRDVRVFTLFAGNAGHFLFFSLLALLGLRALALLSLAFLLTLLQARIG